MRCRDFPSVRVILADFDPNTKVGGVSNVVPATQGRCRIALEDWPSGIAKQVWSAPELRPIGQVFYQLAERLARLVDDSGAVTLVVALDFPKAVIARDPGRSYTLERGSGMVGGKTMRREEGRIDVLIDPGWLVGSESGHLFLKTDSVALMERSITHEAQHVTMLQRGTGFDCYDHTRIEGRIRPYLFDVAAVMCDEHRAECNAIEWTDRVLPTADDVTSVLADLGKALTAAEAKYQLNLDVDALMTDVLSACAPFWISLAYWTAQYRRTDSIGSFSSEVTNLSLWQRYVGESWVWIADALSLVPVSNLAGDPQKLQHSAEHVARVLASSLEIIGFTFTDTPDDPAFHIVNFSYPS